VILRAVALDAEQVGTWLIEAAHAEVDAVAAASDLRHHVVSELSDRVRNAHFQRRLQIAATLDLVLQHGHTVLGVLHVLEEQAHAVVGGPLRRDVRRAEARDQD
jgi:hypothetical protein